MIIKKMIWSNFGCSLSICADKTTSYIWLFIDSDPFYDNGLFINYLVEPCAFYTHTHKYIFRLSCSQNCLDQFDDGIFFNMI